MTVTDILMLEDTYLRSDTATTNYSTDTGLRIGENNASVQVNRGWMKPDFALVPPGDDFISAILKLTPILNRTSNVRTMRAHRCLRAVVVGQATHNIFSTGNSWGTAGASNSASDYDGAVEIGNMSVGLTPTLNVALEMTLDAAELKKIFDGTYTNNGIVLFMDAQNADMMEYASTNHATPAYRPIITLTHATPVKKRLTLLGVG